MLHALSRALRPWIPLVTLVFIAGCTDDDDDVNIEGPDFPTGPGRIYSVQAVDFNTVDGVSVTASYGRIPVSGSHPVVILVHQVGIAEAHQEWLSSGVFEALLEQGLRAFRPLAVAAQTGITHEQYHDLASAFLQTAKHPDLGVRYIDLVYAPMLELVAYLQRAGFKVFIVSAGDSGFIRAYSEQVYGIPRENVIGTSAHYKLRETDAGLAIFRESGSTTPNVLRFKAQNIQLHIGRRPILAVGNSDGDLAMLQYTSDGGGPSLVLLLHHDDANREFGYDEGAEDVLAMAPSHSWHTVSVRNDFSIVFPVPSTD